MKCQLCKSDYMIEDFLLVNGRWLCVFCHSNTDDITIEEFLDMVEEIEGKKSREECVRVLK